MPATVVVGCLVVVRTVTLTPARAQSPATQPTIRVPDDAPIRRWFDRLADRDPKVRSQARVDLMGLGLDDLPALRQLVVEHQPLVSTQAAALHDIVIQMFLRDEKYDVTDGRTTFKTTIDGDQRPFFLGIRWLDPYEVEPRLGVPFDERLPGFPGFRYLQPGDMIMGVYFDPTLPLDQSPNTETHLPSMLINAIKGSPEVQNIVLQVLRDGERIRIAIKMAPKPMQEFDALEGFTADRVTRADAYWREKFVPLLDERYVGDPAETPAAQ